MPRHRTFLVAALASTAALVLAAAPATSNALLAQQERPAAQIRLPTRDITLRIGETAQLEVAVLDADGELLADAEVVFVSLRRRAVTAADDGALTAHEPGDHSVLVMVPSPDGNSSASLRETVTVRVPTPAVTQVVLGELPATLYAGTRVRWQAHALDQHGIERQVPVEYTSTAPDIAAVDRFGYLLLHRPGRVRIDVAAGGGAASVDVEVLRNPTAAVRLGSDVDHARTGDVVHFVAEVVDGTGAMVSGVPVEWALQARTDQDRRGAPSSGLVDDQGRFVADLPGEYTVMARAGGVSATATVVVTPRDVTRSIELVGHGPVRDRFTSDLWVWEAADGRDYALTGTWSAEGHAYLWDVTDPASMKHVDTIKVDARTVNDVKVTADGKVAVISREGASNRRNGLVILDVSDPASGMRVLSRYDDELTGGVHNVFLYENHIYALSAGQRYDIINIEDPANPHRVGRFELDTPGHSIHDVWVQDGVAYSSNWSDGVVAVDVGGGGMGGSPRNPVKMGSYTYPSGWNHAAYPYRSKSTGKLYVFAGDEAGLNGVQPGYDEWLDLMDGYIHVIEWNPDGASREVARYRVPGGGSHNLWVEDDILYIGYYQGGLRVVDVSGELMGDLYRQGREIGYFLPLDPQGRIANVAMTWGPQPHKGNVFFSDMHSGLWAVRIAEQ